MQPPSPRRLRFSKPTLPTVLIALTALAGLLVIVYPSTASWISQYRQSINIIDYNSSVQAESPRWLTEEFDRAQEYNAALNSGQAIIEKHQSVPTTPHPSAPGADGYDELLKLDSEGLMGRLQINSVDLDLPIYHGTSEATLLKGVGHLKGTALPVGGEGTRSVLTAHRGLASATLFSHLDRVTLGDTIALTVSGETLSYRVVDTRVVAPDQTELLLPEPGADLVTLVTCTPLGVNTHRILVTGERVYPTPVTDLEASAEAPEVPRFPWWALILAGGGAVIVVYLATDGFRRSPERRSTPNGLILAQVIE